MTNPQTFSVADLAERFGVGAAVVLAWIRAGELRALNVGRPGARRATWRVTAEALAAFQAGRTALPLAPKRRRKKSPAEVIEFY